MNGKGDKPRPIADREKYRENYDAIFNKDKESVSGLFIYEQNKDLATIYCTICDTYYTGKHDRDDCIMALENKALDK
jgi:hypothetical protein